MNSLVIILLLLILDHPISFIPMKSRIGLLASIEASSTL